MEVYSIDTGYFKLDGGAMYGVVPKKLWNKLNPSDENNLCTWAMRCLLVKDGDRIILFDTGMGAKQDEKFQAHFEPHGEGSLVASVIDAGFQPAEITDVFLTHLHFDHCGGALYKNKEGVVLPTFPRASYWTNKAHLESALTPNFREKASFLKENIVPLVEGGYMKYLDPEPGVHLTDNIVVDFYYGHTTAMMVPTITFPSGKKLIFPADLLPSASHTRMPYVMSYDINPLVTLSEKETFYEKILDEHTYLFFEHDKDHVLGQLIKNEKGRYAMKTGIDGLLSELV